MAPPVFTLTRFVREEKGVNYRVVAGLVFLISVALENELPLAKINLVTRRIESEKLYAHHDPPFSLSPASNTRMHTYANRDRSLHSQVTDTPE